MSGFHRQLLLDLRFVQSGHFLLQGVCWQTTNFSTDQCLISLIHMNHRLLVSVFLLLDKGVFTENVLMFVLSN